MVLHMDTLNQFLIFCPSSDVSHLTGVQPPPSVIPTPGTTVATAAPGVCLNVECLNNGVCVVDGGMPECRCVLFGN